MNTRVAAIVLASAVCAVVGAPIRDAGACSCIGPQAAVITPDRGDDVPINTRVRVELPSSASGGKSGGNVVLRVHPVGTEVATTSRTMTPGGWLSLVELIPQTPLAPSTRYVVAVVDAAQHPSTTVVGTFKTGTSSDAAAPQIDAMGAAVAHRNANASGGSCQVPGPWVTVDTVRAADPGRRDGQIVFGVWLGDATGRIDTTKPPTTMLRSFDGNLHIGQTSLCDPRAFPFPATPYAWLGIAALDEAGNASTVRKMRVDLRGGAPSP